MQQLNKFKFNVIKIYKCNKIIESFNFCGKNKGNCKYILCYNGAVLRGIEKIYKFFIKTFKKQLTSGWK